MGESTHPCEDLNIENYLCFSCCGGLEKDFDSSLFSYIYHNFVSPFCNHYLTINGLDM